MKMSLSTQIGVYDGCIIFQFLLLLLQSLIFLQCHFDRLGKEDTGHGNAYVIQNIGLGQSKRPLECQDGKTHSKLTDKGENPGKGMKFVCLSRSNTPVLDEGK